MPMFKALNFQGPAKEECSNCGAWFKLHSNKCPRCFTAQEGLIMNTWRNYKNRLVADKPNNTRIVKRNRPL